MLVDFRSRCFPWKFLCILFVCCLVVPLCALLARGTSIVAKLEKDRIILAADSRSVASSAIRGVTQREYRDDACKLALFNKAAVAVGALIDYKNDGPRDGLRDWSALSDAKQANDLYPRDLEMMAGDWADRAKLHFSDFNRLAPERVRELAKSNSGILVHAYFVGWSAKAEPILIYEQVILMPNVPQGVAKRGQILPQRLLPYTTHGITLDLFEGSSGRTNSFNRSWSTLWDKFPPSERDWRWLEFAIQSTNAYDEEVGLRVNVLQLPLNGQSDWIQNLTCPK